MAFREGSLYFSDTLEANPEWTRKCRGPVTKVLGGSKVTKTCLTYPESTSTPPEGLSSARATWRRRCRQPSGRWEWPALDPC